LYFLSSPCILPRVTGRTSLILRMILSFLQPFAGTLHFPNLNLCTSCQHYVYFPILLFVYFLILLLCTFLNIGKAYAKKNIKKYGLVYFPKFNMCTSKTEMRPCTSRLKMVVLLVIFGDDPFFSSNLWEILHFQNWIFVFLTSICVHHALIFI
jgi:hypothetical protein